MAGRDVLHGCDTFDTEQTLLTHLCMLADVHPDHNESENEMQATVCATIRVKKEG